MQAQTLDAGTMTGGWPARIARVVGIPSTVGVALQPIVDLQRGKVAGYEALARLPGPGGPEPWFAAAARYALGDAFEAAVLGRTLSRRAELPPNAFLSVNVSPAALLSDPVQAAFGVLGSLAGVVVEITEQAAVVDYSELVGAADALRGRGALLAVDDMGAGHASLSHVLRLRPDFVKLDRGLVQDCDHDQARLAVLEMLGHFAGRIDAWVVAEGIERQAELDAVTRMGMPLAQGYHLARPAAEVVTLRPGLEADIAEVAARRSARTGLSALVEAAPVVDGDDPEAVQAAWQRADPPRHVVLADLQGRPFALLLDPEGTRVAVTTTQIHDPADEVAHRAMVRPVAQRFDPMVVCDDVGRAIGLVTMERLVCHLADQRATAAGDPRTA